MRKNVQSYALNCTQGKPNCQRDPTGQWKDWRRYGLHRFALQRFDWAPTEKSAVLSSFLWGYMSTQVAGGALSARGGASRILAGALGLSGLLTALLPLMAETGGWAAVAGVRAVTGFVQVQERKRPFLEAACCVGRHWPVLTQSARVRLFGSSWVILDQGKRNV